MKKIKITTVLRSAVIPAFLFTVSCFMAGEPAYNTANTTKSNSANSSANNSGNFANSQNAAPPPNIGNVAADSNPVNQTAANSSNTSKGNSSQENNSLLPSTPTPAPVSSTTPTATPAEDPKQNNSDKKDEGMFSFPPPKPTTYITREVVTDPNQQIILEQYVSKIRETLIQNGYPEDRLVYFSHKREFALVTGLERIDENGKPLAKIRWSEAIPTATGFVEYLNYLFYGKRILYRFTAFVISDENMNPRRGQIPEFETAKNWIEKGSISMEEMPVGGGTPQTFALDKKFKCYILIYNFEKHVGAGKEVFLRDFVPAKNQLYVTGLEF